MYSQYSDVILGISFGHTFLSQDLHLYELVLGIGGGGGGICELWCIGRVGSRVNQPSSWAGWGPLGVFVYVAGVSGWELLGLPLYTFKVGGDSRSNQPSSRVLSGGGSLSVPKTRTPPLLSELSPLISKLSTLLVTSMSLISGGVLEVGASLYSGLPLGDFDGC